LIPTIPAWTSNWNCLATSVAREDRGSVAVWVVVDEPNGLVVRVDARDAEDRAEDLVLVCLHPRRHVVDQRRLEEEAVLRRRVATVDQHRRTLARRVFDV
jgi:hypothetical protein